MRVTVRRILIDDPEFIFPPSLQQVALYRSMQGTSELHSALAKNKMKVSRQESEIPLCMLLSVAQLTLYDSDVLHCINSDFRVAIFARVCFSNGGSSGTALLVRSQQPQNQFSWIWQGRHRFVEYLTELVQHNFYGHYVSV
jgi:hypothetical protein